MTVSCHRFKKRTERDRPVWGAELTCTKSGGDWWEHFPIKNLFLSYSQKPSGYCSVVSTNCNPMNTAPSALLCPRPKIPLSAWWQGMSWFNKDMSPLLPGLLALLAPLQQNIRHILLTLSKSLNIESLRWLARRYDTPRTNRWIISIHLLLSISTSQILLKIDFSINPYFFNITFYSWRPTPTPRKSMERRNWKTTVNRQVDRTMNEWLHFSLSP